MRFQFKNTSKHPTLLVRRIVREAWDAVFENQSRQPEKGFRIWIKNTDYGYAGRSYSDKISIRIAKNFKFPLSAQYPGLKTAPKYELNDWQEVLFAIAFHEIQHKLERMAGFGFSEIDVENKTVAALTQFRLKRPELDKEFAELQTTKLQISMQKIKDEPLKNVQAVQKKLLKWRRKLKLAHTKVKKLTSKFNRLNNALTVVERLDI